MVMKRWDSVNFVDCTIAKRWNGTAWVDLTLAKRWNGSSWVDIPLPGGGTPPLGVTISPGSAYGEVSITNPPYPSARTVFSNTVTANATGGTGTASYTWALVSGNSGITPTNYFSASTAFSASVVRNREVTARWRCTVVKGAETVFAEVNVNLAYYSGDLV